MSEWKPIDTAPKDGTHILAYRMPIGIRTTNMTNPPAVVHWFDDPGEPGFYTSVNELAPDHPFMATHWQHLPDPPMLTKEIETAKRAIGAEETKMDHSDYDAIMLRLEPWVRATVRDEMRMEKGGPLLTDDHNAAFDMEVAAGQAQSDAVENREVSATEAAAPLTEPVKPLV